MLTKFRNQSVRGRLIRLVGLIVLLLTAVSSYLAYRNYRSVGETMIAAQSRVAEDFAFRTRLWFRGMLRAAEAFAATSGRVSSDAEREALCLEDGRRMLTSSPTFVAMVIHGEGERACAATLGRGEATAALIAASRRQLGLEALESWGTPLPYPFRYSSIEIDGQAVGIVQLRGLERDSAVHAISLFVSMKQLDALFDLGDLQSGNVVGLVQTTSGRTLALRGADDADQTWLPEDAKLPAGSQRWRGSSKAGRSLAYVSHEVVRPDLIMLAAFSEEATRLSQFRLAILAVAPILLLLAFMAAYWRMVDRDIGRSIDTIESTARKASGGDFNAAVPVDDDMPLELRRASEAVNEIIRAASTRQDQLMASSLRYQDLMRELHHRVKNSLQVIQSYLALTRRDARNRDSATLRETEANVQVLSAAYRFALTDQGLRPVPVALFLGELFSNMVISARSTDQRIIGRADTAAQLDVDRAIPLGLAIAEVTYSILRAGSPAVLIQATDDSVGNLHLVVSTIGDAGQVRLNDRTLVGLRLQLAAVDDRLRENELLRWVVGMHGANGKD